MSFLQKPNEGRLYQNDEGSSNPVRLGAPPCLVQENIATSRPGTWKAHGPAWPNWPSRLVGRRLAVLLQPASRLGQLGQIAGLKQPSSWCMERQSASTAQHRRGAKHQS
jgi:hypothetical protein